MKRVKVYLTALVAIIILAISANVYAYGSQVDTTNAITMPSNLSNGAGEVSSTITGSMKYQFVEITSDKYTKIKKYETIYNLINAYIKGDSNYDILATNYEKAYNQTANGIMSEYGIQFNEEGLNAIKGLWITELTTYSSSAWVDANGKTISLDLTTFEGTKYYIAWVQIGDTYDAEAYKVVGTKSSNTDNGNNNQTGDNNQTGNQTTGKNNTAKDNSSSATGSDTTTSSASTLPKTGVSSLLILMIVLVTVVAGISYIKYRKIK